MLYALLAYHVEEDVASWAPQEDAGLMVELGKCTTASSRRGRIGPAARLGATKGACVLRGPGKGVVVDGPFTESKEQLLGFYVIDCADRDAAISAARELRRVNPTAMYEIRPVRLYRPGVAFPLTEAAAAAGEAGVSRRPPCAVRMHRQTRQNNRRGRWRPARGIVEPQRRLSRPGAWG
jgi:hypothetical protein